MHSLSRQTHGQQCRKSPSWGAVGPASGSPEWDLRPCQVAGTDRSMECMTHGPERLVLSRAESFELLATAWIGRVILTSNAMPTAMPVHFALDDGTIVFRSGEGMKLAARSGTVVAFQADEFDPELKRGWSVLVTGLARRISDHAEVERAHALNIPAWVGPSADWLYARIEAGVVDGRRLVPYTDLTRPA
jgi:hypothetical protein